MARSWPWSRSFRLACALAILVTLLAAPGVAAQEQGGEKPYYSDTQGPPQPGGVVNYLLYEDPDTLNPIIGQT